MAAHITDVPWSVPVGYDDFFGRNKYLWLESGGC